MNSALKMKKPTANKGQTQISSFFQTAPKNNSHLFTVVGDETNKNEALTRLRTRSPSSFDREDDEIAPTPEAVSKKLFLREPPVLCDNKNTRKEVRSRLFEDEKSEKLNTKSVKRPSVDLLANPNSKLSKKDGSFTKIEEIEFAVPFVDETQFEVDVKKKIPLQSLSVVEETQLENGVIVDETQFRDSETNCIDLQSISVIKETQFSEKMIVEETQFDETKKLDVNSVKVIEETQFSDEITNFRVENKENLDHLIIDDELLKYFDQLSPFKPQTRVVSEPKPIVAPFLTGFGRHVVRNIEKFKDEIVLSVQNEEDGVMKTCRLKGCWTQTNVKLNDVVNILSSFDSNQVATIDNWNGLIVVNPDHLISGTAVVSSLFCMRKSVFMERFRGSEPGIFIMVVGSLIHQIFQEAICRQAFKSEEIKSIAKTIITHNSNLLAIYSAGSNETEITAEIDKFIPQIQSWFQQYIIKTGELADESLRVTNIHDIEENIWSPRYGVKGKIDVTAQVEIHRRGKRLEKTIPVELKTGKSSFSPEHEGQVILYSMMCSDRRSDPEGGLLVYLRDGKTKQIKAEHNQKRGLVQLRNELIYYIDQTINSDEVINVPLLPETLNNHRWCSKCPYATVCCLYKSLEKDNLPSDHDMRRLIPEFIGHLSENHIKYFIKWQHLLHLESTSTKNFSFLNGIYCQTSDEREKKGLAFTQMKVESKDSISETSNGLFVMTFSKADANRNSISNIDVTVGEMVLISCEATKEFAIASGTVREVSDSHVQVEIDKNLSLRPDFSSAVFRLDRYTSGNITAIAAGSLLKLMENNDVSRKLRKLIIDGEKPVFIDKLTNSVLKGKRILKTLNSSQTRAVIKSLTAQDYFLIKGMPGTGKTSTIVALVRLLDLLGYSVLLTSHTHTAVDNILIKLKNHGIDFLRLGKCSKMRKEIQCFSDEKLSRNLKSVEELDQFYRSKRIFATTCLGIGHSCLHRKKFDFCIVDEAAQIVQIACLGPLFYSNRFILIGDPLQLPPLVQNKVAKRKGMDQSLFSLLDSPETTVDLNVQYRMNSVIMNLANKLVYEGKLKCGSDSVAKSTLKTGNFASKSKIFSNSLEDSVIFINTDGIPAPELNNNSGIRNEIEAEIVLRITTQFENSNFDMSELGIISAYTAQVKHIRELLTQNNLTTTEVNTVDQYQGRDKEVIIVSFVRSTNNIDILGEILFDIRRLNVAITRAKHKLILIGSISTLSHYPPIQKLIEILHEKIIHFDNSFPNFF